MDGDTLLNFALVLFFVLLGGVFAGTEMALVSLREGQIRQIESAGPRGAKIADLARNPNRFLSAVQIGVTLSGFFSAAYGGSTIAPDLAPVLESWGMPAAAANSTALVGMTLLVAYLSLVLGELVPKRLAMQSAVAFTRVLAPPLNLFSRLMGPVIWLLSASTNAVVRLLRGNPAATNQIITVDELRYMVAEHPTLDPESRGIVTDVFGAGDRMLTEVMRPRTEVEFIDSTLNLEEARAYTRSRPYSRYPVRGETSDDVLGFIHVRDLIPGPAGDGDARVADIARKILPLPGTNKVLSSLARMRSEGYHIVLVVDEYGGTDGIVTLEDLVEELIGEIYDEYDAAREPEDSVRRSAGAVEVDGGLILQEFESLAGIDLPEGRYETVAGFIIDRLGRLPRAGDELDAEGHRFTVLSMNKLRIGRVKVAKLPEEDDGGAQGRRSG